MLKSAAIVAGAMIVGLPLASVLSYRFLPIPATPLMAIRVVEGYGWAHRSADLEEISPALIRAVIAAEDGRFCAHAGFDWSAIREAWADYKRGEGLRGASTISMQTTKNVFLWPARSWSRKALEAYLTLYVEALWPKRRIIEAYLNVAEFGPGIYGAEAAAWRFFRKRAAALTSREASLLAAVLPNPLDRNVLKPSRSVADYATRIRRRAGQIGDLADCALVG